MWRPGPADASFDDLGGFDQIIVGSIKNFVAIGMLLASVTLSKSLAGAGAGMVIGGTAGLGLMTGRMFKGARYGYGKGKGGAGYAHARGKAGSEKYRAVSKKVSGIAEKTPGIRKMYLGKQSEKAQKKKELVVKYEKTLEPLENKQRKTYVDSSDDLIKNPEEKAAARQAHLNLLAKDRGENLSDERLDKKVGYGNIDALRKDTESIERQDGDTSEIKKYRPDLIVDDTKRREKILETIDKDEEKKIHPDALKNKDDHKLFKDKLGDKRYKSWLESQSETRKDGISDHYKTTELRDPATGAVDLDVSKLVTAFDKGSSDITKSIKESFKNFDPATGASIDFTPGDANEGAYKAFIGELKSLGELNKEQLKEAVAYTNRQQLASSTRTTTGAQKEIIYRELEVMPARNAEQQAAWDYVQTNASWRRS